MVLAEKTLILGKDVPSLVNWGRSPDADLLYRALVIIGPCTAGGLARDLGMTTCRVTSALDELASIGAAVAAKTSARRAAVWTAAAPATVAESVRRSRLTVRDIDPRYRERHVLTNRLIAQGRSFGEGMRHLQTRTLARARLAELVNGVRHEHVAMNTEDSFDAVSAAFGVATDRTLLKHGVRARVLGMQPAYPDPMLRYGRQQDEQSPIYREASTVPMKLLVLDRRIALFPVDPSAFDRGYLEVTQPPLVAALLTLFEKHWESGQDPEELAVPQIILNPRERTLVGLLARGHTDASAARELRISTRSVSNIMRTLMDRVGVNNRFQLGLALGAIHVAVSPPKNSEPRPLQGRKINDTTQA